VTDHFAVDIHTHILPKKIPNFHKEFGYGDFISLDHHKPNYANMIKGNEFFREIYCNCWSPQVRIDECNESQIQVQVLSTVPVMFSYWAKPNDGYKVAKYLNDDISNTVNKNRQNFVGLGTLPMQDPELAVEELDRCINELNLQGVEIGSHVNDWNLNDDTLSPIFKRAEKLGASIFVHPCDIMGFNRMEKYWLPWLVGMPAETSLAICSMIFGGVFEKLPKLKVAFAHGGGSFPQTFGRIEHGFNVRPDLVAIDNQTNPRKYLGNFWLDSLVHDHNVLDFIVELVGEDKVCLGTDYPFPLGELEPGKLIKSANLNEKIKSKLLSENALDWLGMKKSDFN
jgi:aminocarboxymuconate-semialdehyde decarboxylase